MYSRFSALLICFSLFASANNPPMWQHWNASVIDTIANSRTVEIGDINADGKLDFVVGAGNGSTTGAIAWYENTGALNFSKHSTDVPVNSSILTVRIGDLDQANGLDFVAVNYAQDAVYWLKNDGALNFSRESLPGTPPDAPTGLDLEDLNNDGYIDAVITNQFNRDHVYWYENDGSSSFTQHIAFDFLENDALHRVRAEFIDADGFRDLIVSQWGEDTDGIIHPDLFWLKNNGNGTFDPTNRVINPAGSPHSGHRKFVTSDIDDDGDADILITSRESGSAIWYENDGAGVFTENIIITRPEWTVTHSIIATDIDSDGDKDVIVTSDNLVALLENDGSEVFTFHEMYSENSSTYNVASADLDNNGSSEAIIVDFQSGEITLLRQFGSFSITENSPAAGVVTANDLDSDPLTYSISGGPDSAQLTVNSATGALSFSTTPDFEQPTDSNLDNVYNIIVSVNDGSVSVPLPVTITVNNIVETTSLSGSPAIFINEDNSYSFQPFLTPGELTNPVFSITNKPPWASFNTATGELTGTPTNNDVGNYSDITISVSDGN